MTKEMGPLCALQMSPLETIKAFKDLLSTLEEKIFAECLPLFLSKKSPYYQG